MANKRTKVKNPKYILKQTIETSNVDYARALDSVSQKINTLNGQVTVLEAKKLQLQGAVAALSKIIQG